MTKLALSTAAAFLLAAAPAFAQGTPEQRTACAPDAVRLCQDTIPDIPKTKACMQAHFSELSRRCQVAFGAATGGSPPASVARRETAPPAAAVAPTPAPEAAAAPPPERVPGMRAYEAQIRGYCRQGLIDPFTCRNTFAALHAVE